MKINKKQLIGISLIFLLFGLLFGYIWGFNDGVEKTIDLGMRVLQLDDTLFKKIALNYQGKIKILLEIAGI